MKSSACTRALHRIPLAMLGLALVCSGCTTQRQRRQPAPQSERTARVPAAPPAPAADGQLTPIDGPGLIARVRASGRTGTVVNVWASWCGSCKRELPMLASLAEALRAEGLGLMLVSADEANARGAAAELIATLSPRPTEPAFIVTGSLAPFKRALNPAWKGAIPSTFLFDADGQLRYFWPGPVLEHEITTIVSAFLAGRELEGPVYVEPNPPPG